MVMREWAIERREAVVKIQAIVIAERHCEERGAIVIQGSHYEEMGPL
jgi:hypothetical protein